MTWAEFLKTTGATREDVEKMLAADLPYDVAAFLNTVVREWISAGKLIQAIKKLRGQYNLHLKEAKTVVDAIRDGAVVRGGRKITSEAVDAVEAIEVACRKAIRCSANDPKTVAALTAVRHQLAELWDDLVFPSN